MRGVGAVARLLVLRRADGILIDTVARRVMWMVPISPAGMRGLLMPALLHPGEEFVAVVADVAAELQPRRTGAGHPPVLDGAQGHAEEVGDLAAGEENGRGLIRNGQVRPVVRQYAAVTSSIRGRTPRIGSRGRAGAIFRPVSRHQARNGR